MSCYTTNATGALFLALIIYDIVKSEYDNIFSHIFAGTILTGIVYLACVLIGEAASVAVMLVPLVFFVTIWFTTESMKKRKCCSSCGSDVPTPQPLPVRSVLVKKEPRLQSECGSANLNAQRIV